MEYIIAIIRLASNLIFLLILQNCLENAYKYRNMFAFQTNKTRKIKIATYI